MSVQVIEKIPFSEKLVDKMGELLLDLLLILCGLIIHLPALLVSFCFGAMGLAAGYWSLSMLYQGIFGGFGFTGLAMGLFIFGFSGIVACALLYAAAISFDFLAPS